MKNPSVFFLTGETMYNVWLRPGILFLPATLGSGLQNGNAGMYHKPCMSKYTDVFNTKRLFTDCTDSNVTPFLCTCCCVAKA